MVERISSTSRHMCIRTALIPLHFVSDASQVTRSSATRPWQTVPDPLPDVTSRDRRDSLHVTAPARTGRLGPMAAPALVTCVVSPGFDFADLRARCRSGLSPFVGVEKTRTEEDP